MKFRDLFVPRWQHSNPEVRARAVAGIKDVKLLEQISYSDESEAVREMAQARLESIQQRTVKAEI